MDGSECHDDTETSSERLSADGAIKKNKTRRTFPIRCRASSDAKKPHSVWSISYVLVVFPP